MEEIWKDIPWYEDYYMVSNLWNIKSLQFRNHLVQKYREKNLKKFNNNHWYEIVQLSIDWVYDRFLVHRLVASAFLWLPLFYKWHNKSMAVCHKDDNPKNNRLDNLFIALQTENMFDCIKKWRHHTLWHIPSNRKTILQYDKEMNFIREWEWSVKIYNELWISSANIVNVCNMKPKNKTAGWYIWRYKNPT